MTTPRPVRDKSAGSAALALVAVAGISAGATVLLGYGLAYGFGAGPPKAETGMRPARAAAPAPAPSAAMMRPLPIPPQNRQVTARRASDGQFYFDTAVAGTGIRMMFDTGASVIALRAEDAVRAGIAVNTLDYTVNVSTANGTTRAAPVMLGTVRVGDIVRRDVAALVLKPGKLDISLLGQSFMTRLAGYRYEAGELILQDN